MRPFPGANRSIYKQKRNERLVGIAVPLLKIRLRVYYSTPPRKCKGFVLINLRQAKIYLVT